MLFLTSELVNEAEIIILSARDTTRAWVPGRGIMGMGRNLGVYNGSYTMMAKPMKTLHLHYPMIQFLIRMSITRGCHLGFRTNRVLFVSFCLIFSLFSSFFARYHASSPVGSVVLISFL